MDRLLKYRRYAADCYAAANQLPDLLSKARMLAMAQSWLVLADQAEQDDGIQFRSSVPSEADHYAQ